MKLIEDTLYHKVLRVALVVCAVMLVFESGVVSHTTKSLSLNTHRYLANAIGVGATVAPTEVNTLTAELTKQKLALAEREAAVTEREIAVELSQQSDTNSDVATYILAGILFILLVLIVLNYILDYLHRREIRMVPIASRV